MTKHGLPPPEKSKVVRPMWDAGWEAVVRINFDERIFSVIDIANLLCVAGWHVGIGEWRPGNKPRASLGFGLFKIKTIHLKANSMTTTKKTASGAPNPKKKNTNGVSKNRIADIPTKAQDVVIAPPNFQVAEFTICGQSPYVQNKFSQKAKEMMKAKQEAGSQAKKGGKREPKDFQQCYEDAKYVSREGWVGIPATCFRAAMVSACRTVGFVMTKAKLGFFIEADGYEKNEGVPLVKFTKGEPHYFEQAVRNESGVADIRARPMWDEGWEAIVRVKFDGDMFSASDIANLLHRAGEQVGIGEGRPDSKKCVGLGWGTFSLK